MYVCMYVCMYVRMYETLPPPPPSRGFFLIWRRGPKRAMVSSFLRFLITHNDAPQSVGHLWTCDQPVTETST